MNRMSRMVLAALALPLLLVLSSCMRMQMDIKVVSLDQIEMSLNVGVKKELAQAGGQAMTGAQLCEQKNMPDNAKTEPYDDGTYIGCKVSGTATKLDEMLSFDSASQVWTFHMPGSDLAQGGQQVSADMISDFKVAVTFPGEVLTKSGEATVSGTTVTWTKPADLFSGEGLKATAKATGGVGALPAWLWVVIGLVALAVIGALVYFLVLKKKPASVPTQPPAGGQAYPGQPYPQPGPAPQGYQPPPAYPPAPGPQGYQPPPASPPAAQGAPQGYQSPQTSPPAAQDTSQAYQPPSATQGDVSSQSPQGYEPPVTQQGEPPAQPSR